jgi:hypothetical protein
VPFADTTCAFALDEFAVVAKFVIAYVDTGACTNLCGLCLLQFYFVVAIIYFNQ